MAASEPLGELVPCGGGDSIPLLREKLLIGRGNSCDIMLRFPNVSSRHCELELLNGYWHVRDAGSRNGIKVNGERCDSKWLLPGDELSVARHRYEINYQPDTSAPPPEEEDPFATSLMEKAGLARNTRTPRARPSSEEPSKRRTQEADSPEQRKSTSSGSDDDDMALRFLDEE